MADRTGRVILSKGIKLDKQYKNVLNYTENEMVTLCTNNKVYETTNCSIIKENEVLELDVTYGDALKCNYLAFQNPHYSNKWFFAFIDRCEYVSEQCTRIYFSIDELSTWRDYWDIKTCFVVREHVNDDTYGLHTLIEGLETGDYIRGSTGADYAYNGQFYLAFQVTELISNMDVAGIGSNRLYNGIYNGLYIVLVDNYTTADLLVSAYDDAGKHGSIISCFYVPKSLCPDAIENDGCVLHGTTVTIYFPQPTSSIVTFDQVTVNKPTTIDGYTPKNNKLFTKEYCFILASNNAGSNTQFAFEDFKNVSSYTTETPTFSISGVLSQGCSIRLEPSVYYKQPYEVPNYSGYNSVAKYGITAGKLPICSWNSDYYTNWCTQNAVNIPATIIEGAWSASTKMMYGDVVGAGLSVVNSIASLMDKKYQASIVPDQAKGNVNSGDFNFSSNLHFTLTTMTIKREYAEIIDDYFSRNGYKINRLKVPNETGRTYWNYVQISSESSIGVTKSTISVPTNSMDVINNAYRSGVTIWHNHDNIGDYSLNNTIVTP